MRYQLVLSFFLITVCCGAQQPYDHSIIAYQLKYKTDLANDIKADTSHVSFYPIDPAFNVAARVGRLKNEPVFNMTTSSGKTKEAQKFAQLRFTIRGKEYMLTAYQLLKLKNSKEYADHVFIPFTDLTSGNESYGGGRYIDFKISEIKNDKLLLDFNKAYNPYCAFVEGYNCPIPPSENRLSILVTAGEKRFAKEH